MSAPAPHTLADFPGRRPVAFATDWSASTPAYPILPTNRACPGQTRPPQARCPIDIKVFVFGLDTLAPTPSRSSLTFRHVYCGADRLALGPVPFVSRAPPMSGRCPSDGPSARGPWRGQWQPEPLLLPSLRTPQEGRDVPGGPARRRSKASPSSTKSSSPHPISISIALFLTVKRHRGRAWRPTRGHSRSGKSLWRNGVPGPKTHRQGRSSRVKLR